MKALIILIGFFPFFALFSMVVSAYDSELNWNIFLISTGAYGVLQLFWWYVKFKLSASSDPFMHLYYKVLTFIKMYCFVWGSVLLPVSILFLTSGLLGLGKLVGFLWGNRILYIGHLILVVVVLIKLIKEIVVIRKSINPSTNYFKKTGGVAVFMFLTIMSLFLWQINLIIFTSSLAQITGNAIFCKLPFVKLTESENLMYPKWTGAYKECLGNADYKTFQKQYSECSTHVPDTPPYASCMIKKYLDETVYTNESISCENMYVYDDSCERIKVIQKAIQTQNPDLCNTIEINNYREYAFCIGQFQNTTVHANGCEMLEESISKSDFAANLSNFLISGRCLSSLSANKTLYGSVKGPIDFFGKYRNVEGYKNYFAPTWFEDLRDWKKQDFEYLESIHADPNITDSLGRTALILEIQDRLYLNDNVVHDFDYLPKKQQLDAAKDAVKTVQLLIDFGVDPNIKDKLNLTAIDYASQIKNTIFREQMLQVLKENFVEQ